MGNVLVQMKNISKSFSGTKVLKGVNLELGHGEILALLGENGAGKSTLMKILSGIYSKDEGEIYLDGELCHFQNPKEAQNQGVAIIHQEMNLCNDLSVSENIFLGREVMDGLRLNHKKMYEEELYAYIEKWKKQGYAFLFFSSEPSDAQKPCERLGVWKEKRILKVIDKNE